MKPIAALVVCESLTASVQILVQFLDLLGGILVLFSADVYRRLCEEISVLELNYLFCVVLYHPVQNVGANLFRSPQYRLIPSAIPIQVFLFITVQAMYDKSLIQFMKHIVRIDDICIGSDVSSAKQKRCFKTQVSLDSVAVCVFTSHVSLHYFATLTPPLCVSVAPQPT